MGTIKYVMDTTVLPIVCNLIRVEDLTIEEDECQIMWLM